MLESSSCPVRLLIRFSRERSGFVPADRRLVLGFYLVFDLRFICISSGRGGRVVLLHMFQESELCRPLSRLGQGTALSFVQEQFPFRDAVGVAEERRHRQLLRRARDTEQL